MDGPYAPLMDGWIWMWQMGPAGTLLLLMVVGLGLFGLVTNARGSTTTAASSVK
jgi:hypothetical protein